MKQRRARLVQPPPQRLAAGTLGLKQNGMACPTDSSRESISAPAEGDLRARNSEAGSFRLDVRLANDAAVIVILFAKKGGEILATQPERMLFEAGKRSRNACLWSIRTYASGRFGRH
jgi:hypothetical protein